MFQKNSTFSASVERDDYFYQEVILTFSLFDASAYKEWPELFHYWKYQGAMSCFFRSQQRIYSQSFCLGLSLTLPALSELGNELWIIAPLAPLSEGATSCKVLWLCIFLNSLFLLLFVFLFWLSLKTWLDYR